MSVPRNSLYVLSEYERDPAKAVRRQLEALWAQNARECEQSAKDARNEQLRREYVKRREPETAA